MSRYIDADALKIPSEEMIAKMIINSAPSIDIEPKRGEWQYVYSGKWMFRRCSCCEWTQTYDDSKYIGYRYNFCPNCGADMRGTDDEVR